MEKLERKDTCSPGDARPLRVILSPGLGLVGEISNPQPRDKRKRGRRISILKILVKLPQ
jgi:hypothetical protein